MIRQLVLDSFDKLTGMAKSMALSGLETKRENFKETGQITHWFYDTMVFGKVRSKFGGRIKYLATGSAPLPRDIATDIKVLFSTSIVEGYGMTETFGGIVLTHTKDTTNYSCGGCLRHCIFKLQAIPEMKYGPETLDEAGNHSQTGEICVKGVCCTKGYFRDEINTKQLIDQDGWLHTGDVGRISFDDKGLKIIDRVKEIFKTAQAEYIAPSKLESVYAKSPYVSQIFVHGDSLKSYIIGIIHPNKTGIEKFLKSKELIKEGETVENFYEKEVVLEEVKKNLDELAKQNNFNGIEKLQKLILTGEEFTVSNELLTSTMKLVRRNIAKRYKEKIDLIYV